MLHRTPDAAHADSSAPDDIAAQAQLCTPDADLPGLLDNWRDSLDTGDEDLWERIRAGYSMAGHVDERRVDNQLGIYANQQRLFDTIGPRAASYLRYVVNELEQRNMPLELALLPIVESGYNPQAVSRSNAAGMWQLAPGTAARLGVNQNSWYDGRKDVVASTEAALDYLEELHQRFNGDWYLALAAYNTGEGNVERAIERNRRLGKPTDYWSLKLSDQACNFVPRLVALSRVLEQPEDHGVQLQPIPDAPSVVPVQVDRQVNLQRTATMAGIDSGEFFRLNPAYKRGVTPPNATTHLLVPAEDEHNFLQALQHAPAVPAPVAAAHGTTYRIRTGDSIVSIARLFQTSPDAIRQLNGLSSDAVQVGDTLRIPEDAILPRREYPSSQTVKLKQHGIYVVQAGDSLWTIARRFGLTSAQLAQMNGLDQGVTLRLGQELRVRQEGKLRIAASDKPAAKPRQRLGYTVRKGDSIYGIADRFNVDVGDVMRWNGIKPGRALIKPGQALVIYVGKPAPT